MAEEQPEIAINGDSEQPGAKPDSKPEAEKVESEPQNETDPTSQPSNGEEAAVTESEVGKCFKSNQSLTTFSCLLHIDSSIMLLSTCIRQSILMKPRDT